MGSGRLAGAVAALSFLLGAAAAATGAPPPTPREILDRVDDIYRGRSSRGTLAMRVVTEHWARELRLEFWTEGRERTLLRILAPAKERGIATLRTAGGIWNYLPRVGQVIRLPATMMGASWMGSHFTNDDLVKQSRMSEDYDFSTTFAGERDGVPVAEITCLPKAKAAVVWGKVLVTVRSDDWTPRSVRYFDEDLAPARTLAFSGFRQVGDRRIPLAARMSPAGREGEFTEVLFEDLVFDLPIPEGLFSLRALRR